jgi:hypothetical protein
LDLIPTTSIAHQEARGAYREPLSFSVCVHPQRRRKTGLAYVQIIF